MSLTVNPFFFFIIIYLFICQMMHVVPSHSNTTTTVCPIDTLNSNKKPHQVTANQAQLKGTKKSHTDTFDLFYYTNQLFDFDK